MKRISPNSYIFSGTDLNSGNTVVIRDVNTSGDVMSLQWIINKGVGTPSGTATLNSGSTSDSNAIVDLGGIALGGKNTFATDNKLRTFSVKFSNVQNINSVTLHIV